MMMVSLWLYRVIACTCIAHTWSHAYGSVVTVTTRRLCTPSAHKVFVCAPCTLHQHVRDQRWYESTTQTQRQVQPCCLTCATPIHKHTHATVACITVTYLPLLSLDQPPVLHVYTKVQKGRSSRSNTQNSNNVNECVDTFRNFTKSFMQRKCVTAGIDVMQGHIH